MRVCFSYWSLFHFFLVPFTLSSIILYLLTPSYASLFFQYKDHITLEDYEIHDGMGLEMYYN